MDIQMSQARKTQPSHAQAGASPGPRPEDGMYPMRVVTRLTGLSADTIRVWERRYDAVTPKRTEGNARRYSPEDVRRLNLLREATERGHAISEVARLSEPDLRRMLAETAPVDARGLADQGENLDSAASETLDSAERENLDTVAVEGLDTDGRGGPMGAGRDAGERVSAPDLGPSPLEDAVYGRFCAEYLDAIRRFEVRRGADMLSACALLLEPRAILFEVVQPTLAEVARRCGTGAMSVAHEHLVTVQLKGLVSQIARQLPRPAADAPRVLLATPAGHPADFGALVASFLAGARGFDAIYLGSDLAERDLDSGLALSEARLLILDVSRPAPAVDPAALAGSLARLARRAEVWLTGPAGHPVVRAARAVAGVSVFEGPAALDEALARAAR